jgi:hypothetical protein
MHAVDNHKELTGVLAKSFSSVLTLLRHTLIAFGQDAPDNPEDILAKIAPLTGASVGAFEPVLQLRASGHFGNDVTSVYAAYLEGIEKVIAALDHHVPKRHLQRTSTT